MDRGKGVICLLVVLLLVITACGTAATSTPRPTRVPTATPTISPNGAIIRKFIGPMNEDSLRTISPGVAEPGFDSGLVGPGQSFALKFDRPGTYSFACTLHPAMIGEIVVTE